ncbi:MAG: hypothetical protein F2916_07355, partial [Actinobacteria bacterium]|nr:hypothetical protein [Actinomycetota bacterium]
MSALSPTSRPLGVLATHIVNEPGIEAIAGQRDSVLAVPEVARAAVLAALVNNTTRRPIVIATP